MEKPPYYDEFTGRDRRVWWLYGLWAFILFSPLAFNVVLSKTYLWPLRDALDKTPRADPLWLTLYGDYCRGLAYLLASAALVLLVTFTWRRYRLSSANFIGFSSISVLLAVWREAVVWVHSSNLLNPLHFQTSWPSYEAYGDDPLLGFPATTATTALSLALYIVLLYPASRKVCAYKRWLEARDVGFASP